MSRKLNHPQPKRLLLKLRRPTLRLKLLWTVVSVSPLVSLSALYFSVSFSWQGVLRCSSSSTVCGESAKRLVLANTDIAEWVIWISSSERWLCRSMCFSLINLLLPPCSFDENKMYEIPPWNCDKRGKRVNITTAGDKIAWGAQQK